MPLLSLNPAYWNKILEIILTFLEVKYMYIIYSAVRIDE